MNRSGVPAMLMRGGTSKGLYLLREHLPGDEEERDGLLLRLLGSPDPRQIDGVGGAHPLTSKVAIVAPSEDDEADVDYHFLQVGVDEPIVSGQQNCGNLLAGVGPFAVERGLVAVAGARARIRVRLVNTGSIAVATFPLDDAGGPRYEGDTSISGVPGTAAAVDLTFTDIAGSSCGALLPTGNLVDRFAGIEVTCIDNGMPVVVLRASDVGIRGDESCVELEANEPLCDLLEHLRLEAGPAMGLGDVRDTSVPKLTMLAPPQGDAAAATRTFIPHRCHSAIGVLGAVSVATVCRLPGSVAEGIAVATEEDHVVLEHPTGTFTATVSVVDGDDGPIVEGAGIVRTARKLMDGTVFPRPY